MHFCPDEAAMLAAVLTGGSTAFVFWRHQIARARAAAMRLVFFWRRPAPGKECC